MSFLCIGILFASAPANASSNAQHWTSLFNGRNLDGWSAKINGYELGDNFGNTFRVIDGKIQVNYDAYGGKFNSRFGHLFFKSRFKSYVFRMEYRFFGDQLPDAPGWAYRNSGIMFHCQDPKTMGKDQPFPISLEFQLLGGNGKDERHTGNLATPGTNVVFDGKFDTRHVIDSKSKTYHGDQWVKAELEVRPDGKIIHRINGETVMEYEGVELDPNDANAKKLIDAAGGSKKLDSGWISLQSESTPCEFRNIEIRELK
jgi:hypothetical protein